ncbi:MAG: fluoride efflux transporter CrcB [Clostridia bacterium]|nr:fluoride efflux transporter CrcB [Clostridia bacterium]
MQQILYVGIGGFIGASLRYIISMNAIKIWGPHFPYGTLIVNVIGGILIGLTMELSLTTNLISPDLRLFLTAGILGGLTTFSTFSHETISLFFNNNYGLGILNICLNLFLSLGGVVLGRFFPHLLSM